MLRSSIIVLNKYYGERILRNILERTIMKEPTIERLLLFHEIWKRNLSDDTLEAIVQIVERTRIDQGHTKAEDAAKKIRIILEAENSEEVILQKIEQI